MYSFCLASFIHMITLRFTHFVIWIYSSCLLPRGSIPSCVYTTAIAIVFLPILLLMNIYVVLATTIKTSINIHVQAFVWTYALMLLGKYLRVGWLDPMVGVGLFREAAKCFPKGLYHSAFSPAMYGSAIQLLHILSRLGMVSLFHFSNSNKCVVVFHCGLNCIPLITNDVEHFHVVIFCPYILFDQVPVQMFCPF